MSRAQLTSTVEQNTGGAVAPFVAGKNKIINGDFGIWQRGTSFTAPGSTTYLADRWYIAYDGTGATRTVTQQTFTPGTAPVAGYEGTYYLRFSETVAGTGSTYKIISQKIEDVRIFAGQTVTISFWAKADAARSIGVTLSQNFGSGGSSSVAQYSSYPNALTISWARYTYTFTLASIAGKTIGTNSCLEFDINLNLNTTQVVDIWGVQIEAGSVATPFTTATGTFQGELAACQRYYFRQTGLTTYSTYYVGGTLSTSQGYFFANYPVPMRTIPSTVEYANLALQTGTVYPLTALTIDQQSTTGTRLLGTVSGTPLSVAIVCYLLNNNNTGGYFAMSAEL